MSAKYAITFFLFSSVLLLASWATDLIAVRLIAGCAAVSFGLVSVAYLGLGPRLLLKRSSGRRGAWAWLFHGPYLLLNGLGFRLYRLAERRPPFDLVAPNLYLGRRLTAVEARRPGTPIWSAVLDLAAEFPEVGPLRRAGAYRSMPVLDATAPTPGELSEAVAWLSEQLPGGPVYVHCALGHGRSATIAIAYLLATGRAATVEEGLQSVLSRRAGVRPNPEQMAALRAFARTPAGGAA